MSKLEEVLFEAERMGRRLEVIDKVDQLTKTLPKYTPLTEIYDLALKMVQQQESTQK